MFFSCLSSIFSEFLHPCCSLPRSSSCFQPPVWRAIYSCMAWTFFLPSKIRRNCWFLYSCSKLLYVCQPCHMPQSSLFQTKQFQTVQSFIVCLLSRLHGCNSFSQNLNLAYWHENHNWKQKEKTSQLEEKISVCSGGTIWGGHASAGDCRRVSKETISAIIWNVRTTHIKKTSPHPQEFLEASIFFFPKTIRFFFKWGWWNTGTGSPQRKGPHPWKYSCSGWTRLWATQSSWSSSNCSMRKQH